MKGMRGERVTHLNFKAGVKLKALHTPVNFKSLGSISVMLMFRSEAKWHLDTDKAPDVRCLCLGDLLMAG